MVDHLPNTYTFIRENNEEADKFVASLTTAVMSYINQTKLLSIAMSRKLAVLMLRSTNLSSDRMYTVTFQLTNETNSEIAAFTDISVPKPVFAKLCAMLPADTKVMDSTVHESLKPLFSEWTECERLHNTFFSNHQAARSLTKVAKSHQSIVRLPLLLKRVLIDLERNDNVKRLKSKNGCRACGQTGNSRRDNSQSNDTIRKKRSQNRVEKGVVEAVPSWTNSESLFQQKSQPRFYPT